LPAKTYVNIYILAANKKLLPAKTCVNILILAADKKIITSQNLYKYIYIGCG
jgi:hypothetical protein